MIKVILNLLDRVKFFFEPYEDCNHSLLLGGVVKCYKFEFILLLFFLWWMVNDLSTKNQDLFFRVVVLEDLL